FLFQAEDGIRYFHVTGVQTCALPILKEIKPIKEKITGTLKAVENLTTSTNDPTVIISLKHPDHDFFAVRTTIKKLQDGQYGIDKNLLRNLGVNQEEQDFTAIPF